MTDPQSESEPPDDPHPILRFSGAARMPGGAPLVPEGEGSSDRLPREIETRIEKLAERFDQLEYVIVEQFEPGMSGSGDLPRGNLRDRLDRIESVLGLLSQVDDDRPAPQGHEDPVAERLIEAVGSQAQRADAMEARLDSLIRALDAVSAETRGRHDDLMAAFEKAMHRPMPAPDLTMQHRSFAGFATALQVTLDRMDGAVAGIVGALDGVTARLAALEARAASADMPVTEAPPAADSLGSSLDALCDRIGALTGVLAAATERKKPAEDLAALSMRIDALGAVLSASVEDAVHGNRVAIEETLRDLRLAVAEIAAENHRLQIA